jgi:hypothetical protein
VDNFNASAPGTGRADAGTAVPNCKEICKNTGGTIARMRVPPGTMGRARVFLRRGDNGTSSVGATGGGSHEGDIAMTMTRTETTAATVSSFGGFADALGGVATIVLAIVALAGINTSVMVPIAVIVFGAALLIQGGTLLSEHARILFPSEEAGAVGIEQFSGGNLSAVFLVGASGIVLGVLALLGIAPATLTAVAIIAFGAALVMTSNSVRELYIARRTMMRTGAHSGTELVAGEMASGSAGVQLLAGLTAVVLGILAVAGTNPPILILSALIVLGATVLLSGSTLSGMVMGFMRPAQAL